MMKTGRTVTRAPWMAGVYGALVIVMSAPLVRAQGTQQQSAHRLPNDPAQDSTFALPLPRALTDTPPVAALGRIGRGADTATLFAITPQSALGDLEYAHNAMASGFPLTAPADPSDSLRRADRTRAAAWLARLDPLVTSDPDGSQALARADIATRAENDSAARHIIRALLTTSHNRVARSRILAAAVDLFTRLTTDRGRDTVRLVTAAGYTAELLQLRTTGLATQRDSVSVLYRQADAIFDLVTAACALERVADVRRYSAELMTVVTQVGVRERTALLKWYYPLDDVATLYLEQPNGRRLLDTASDIQRVVALAPPLRAALRRAALIGQPAPPVVAHAWLNTPDSAYAGAPRTHDLTDGHSHLVLFGVATNIPIIERLHQRFPGVHMLLLTATDGTVGLVAADPVTEITWLAQYLRDRRHVTVPVGVWAGARRPTKYGGMVPEPSPNGAAYVDDGSLCVLIDRLGRIQRFIALVSRRDEARVAAILTRLETSGAAPHPTNVAP